MLPWKYAWQQWLNSIKTAQSNRFYGIVRPHRAKKPQSGFFRRQYLTRPGVRSAGSRFRGAGLTRERFLPLGQNSRRRPLKLLLAPFCQAQQRFPWPQPQSGILLAMQELAFRPAVGESARLAFALTADNGICLPMSRFPAAASSLIPLSDGFSPAGFSADLPASAAPQSFQTAFQQTAFGKPPANCTPAGRPLTAGRTGNLFRRQVAGSFSSMDFGNSCE